jgi:hypothetical protein
MTLRSISQEKIKKKVKRREKCCVEGYYRRIVFLFGAFVFPPLKIFIFFFLNQKILSLCGFL